MEELVPLVVHGISWSRRHGHPIVLLRGRGTDAWFAVATDPEMAQAFSTCPCTRDRSLRRLASLVHQLLGAARAVVEAVMLDVDDQGILSAEIVLASPSGAARITAAGLDGLLLATACGIDPVMRRQRLETVTALGADRSQADTDVEPHDLPWAVRELLAELERRSAGNESDR